MNITMIENKETIPIANIAEVRGTKIVIKLNAMTDRATHCSAKFKVNPAKLLIAPTSIANKKLIDNCHGHT